MAKTAKQYTKIMRRKTGKRGGFLGFGEKTKSNKPVFLQYIKVNDTQIVKADQEIIEQKPASLQTFADKQVEYYIPDYWTTFRMNFGALNCSDKIGKLNKIRDIFITKDSPTLSDKNCYIFIDYAKSTTLAVKPVMRIYNGMLHVDIRDKTNAVIKDNENKPLTITGMFDIYINQTVLNKVGGYKYKTRKNRHNKTRRV
jgi:hypothetical protein